MKRTLIVTGFAIMLTSAFAWAQGLGPGGGMRAMRPGGGMRGGNFGASCPGCDLARNPMMASLLNLTEAQKSAIQAESDAAREKTRQLRQQLRDTRRQMADAVSGAASDSTLEGLAKQAGDLEGEILAVSLRARSAIHNQILTAQQRAKLAELRAERRSQHDQRVKRFNRRQPAAPPVNTPAPGPNVP